MGFIAYDTFISGTNFHINNIHKIHTHILKPIHTNKVYYLYVNVYK